MTSGVLYNLYMQNYQSIGVEPSQLDDLWLAWWLQ